MKSTSGLRYRVTLTKTKGALTAQVGLSSATLSGESSIGRDLSNTIAYSDSSVSHQHVLLTPTPEGLRVTNRAEKGSTYLAGHRMTPQESIVVATLPFFLQLGRLLLSVSTVEDTESFSVQMSTPHHNTTPRARFLMVREEPRVEVWLAGRVVALYPSASKMLLALARCPTQTVSYDELARSINPEEHLQVGGMNFAQMATYIRNAVAESIAAGVTSASNLRAHLHQPPDATEDDLRGLLRHLVQSVRGTGYRLNLFPGSVRVLDPHTPLPR